MIVLLSKAIAEMGKQRCFPISNEYKLCNFTNKGEGLAKISNKVKPSGKRYWMKVFNNFRPKNKSLTVER